MSRSAEPGSSTVSTGRTTATTRPPRTTGTTRTTCTTRTTRTTCTTRQPGQAGPATTSQPTATTTGTTETTPKTNVTTEPEIETLGTTATTEPEIEMLGTTATTATTATTNTTAPATTSRPTATTNTTDSGTTPNTPNTADTVDAADTADTADTANTTDTTDSGTPNTANTADTANTANTADTADSDSTGQELTTRTSQATPDPAFPESRLGFGGELRLFGALHQPAIGFALSADVAWRRVALGAGVELNPYLGAGDRDLSVGALHAYAIGEHRVPLGRVTLRQRISVGPAILLQDLNGHSRGSVGLFLEAVPLGLEIQTRVRRLAVLLEAFSLALSAPALAEGRGGEPPLIRYQYRAGVGLRF